MIFNGSQAFEQLPPVSRPIEILCPWVISPAILSRYFHFLIFSGVATSSSSTGKSSFVYVTGKSIHILCPEDLETFKPLTASVSWLSSPFSVFILMVVCTPSAFNFLAKSVLMKVPWLQQSNMAWVLNSFYELLHFTFTGTTHMLTTFDFSLVVAHAKVLWLFC